MATLLLIFGRKLDLLADVDHVGQYHHGIQIFCCACS
ncbi:uncharacterized protein G2W53_030592 [Senna tora]|uniref:Uncharacterized protein n=1 Tax=Senna tora TaxID=362788 RepID=A0A834T6A5_9FABA|nr:uncharacterized protein G2W53_030592 [Senna tora]